jgi:hypothetical protein
VGSGYTKRIEARIKKDIPDDREYTADLRNVPAVSGVGPVFVWYGSYFEWHEADLERWLSSIEGWAKAILERAKIPASDPKPLVYDHLKLREGLHPADDAVSTSVLHVIEKLGFRRGQHVQWHAAAILKHLRVLRANLASGALASPTIAKAVAVSAIQLGSFLREAEIRFGIVAPQSRKGGSQAKSIPAVTSFVRSRLRKSPSLTAGALWRSIPRDECDGLKFGQSKLYVEIDLLRVIGKRNGKWRLVAELSYQTFRKYVTAARKVPAR